MSKVLSVRVEDRLYTKVNNHDLKNKDLLTKALNQFFRSKEKNHRINEFADSDVYSYSIEILNRELQEKSKMIEYLQQEVKDHKVMNVMNMSWLQLIKIKWFQKDKVIELPPHKPNKT